MHRGTNKQIFIGTTFVMLVSIFVPHLMAQDVTVTRSWVDFFGTAVYSDGHPVSLGTLIQAYDPDTTLCGECTVTTEGMYGFMPVYEDDPFTPDVDEGAQEGDLLSFEISGAQALLSGVTEPRWTKDCLKLNIDLVSIETDVASSINVPHSFGLSQNYPNPFNPSTTIKYQLPENSDVILAVYNALGQRVKTLINKKQKAGEYAISWDGIDENGIRVSSGLYFLRLKAGDFVHTCKMILLQ